LEIGYWKLDSNPLIGYWRLDIGDWIVIHILYIIEWISRGRGVYIGENE